jgi:hypothetical protein
MRMYELNVAGALVIFLVTATTRMILDPIHLPIQWLILNFISCIVPHVYGIVCICIYYDKFCIHLLDLLNDK